ncbi:MAG: hypothetical protein HYR88_01425 [Verrucomicrobia bacterium]|nr:hypothetical protein [Verrucomicrobiota bacterium]
MKTKLSSVGLALAVSPLFTPFITPAQANDRGWATAGKVLTGVFAAHAISRVLDPPVYYVAPAPVIVQQPVVVQQAPVVVQTVQSVQATPTYAVPAAPAIPNAPLAPAAPSIGPATTTTTTTTSYVVQQPVYVQPAPVYVAAPPIYPYYGPAYYAPPPLIGFRFGFGYHHGWGHARYGR